MMGGYAFSHSNPKHARLWKTKELRRKGYRKLGERYAPGGVKLLIYVKRNLTKDGWKIISKRAVRPDGSDVELLIEDQTPPTPATYLDLVGES